MTLNVRSPAMVSKSVDWQELADELELRGRLAASEKIGLDVALNRHGKSQTEVERFSQRMLNNLSPEAVNETVEKLNSGEMTIEQAEQMIDIL